MTMVAYLITTTGSRLIRVAGRREVRRKSTDSGGVVEGVWIFARHGDRTPSRSLCPPDRKDEEAAFWRTKLPTPDPVTALKILSEHFPADIHPSNAGEFLDVGRRPFGFLTKVGIEQLRNNGRRFFLRYERDGNFGSTQDGANTDSSLHSWDVQAFSTNYLRTVLSAQCFLDGLLGTKCYKPVDSEETDLDDDESRLVPDHTTCGDANQGTVKIQVRDRAVDNLNAFDRNPQLIKNLVEDVVTSEGFVSHDTTAAPLAAQLAHYLPGLVRETRKTFGGPSGINWIEATDHFVCRRSHGVGFSLFSEFEDDSETERTLEAMERETLDHRAWRFRRWYQNPPLLAEIASPALREILEQMHSTAELGVEEKHPFTLYSCHDVTILALLYGVGADFLADDGNGSWKCAWPDYGTTLVFELVRLQDDDGKASHVVRVLLNGDPVQAVNLLDHKEGDPPEYVGEGPMKMLTMSDFEKIISKLEDVGGMPHEFVPIEDEEFSIGRMVKGDTG